MDRVANMPVYIVLMKSEDQVQKLCDTMVPISTIFNFIQFLGHFDNLYIEENMFFYNSFEISFHAKKGLTIILDYSK